jgi:hypothetical protein
MSICSLSPSNPVQLQTVHPQNNDCSLFVSLEMLYSFDFWKHWSEYQALLISSVLLNFVSKLTLTRVFYEYNRLTFGITSAPSIWQRAIDQILQGLSGVQCVLDDMIITGKSDDEHLQNLEYVLQRLQDNGFRANIEKRLCLQDWMSCRSLVCG